MPNLTINGKQFDLDVEDDMPLLWAIRDAAGLTGTKYGCGKGLCGACTVHIDGEAMRSCVLPVGFATGKSITTIEGLSEDGRSHPLQRAWIAEQVPQCGYCQPGQIMAAAAFLKQNPKPGDDDIRNGITNLCRCGTYLRIRAAIRHAADEMRDGKA
jgi:isoquinoline 1-oxidoreductase alpha subunit